MPPPFTKMFSFVTGAIKRTELIYVIATDDSAKEPQEAHLFLMAWFRGEWMQAGGKPWPAVAVDIATKPAANFLVLGPLGEITAVAPGGTTDEDIPGVKDRGTMRSLRVIDGEAYAAGMDRQVYCRKQSNQWISLDSLAMRPARNEIKGFEAIDGFSSREIYAAGWDGEIWWFNGDIWTQISSPTNLIITALTCAGDGFVYAALRGGPLLRGRGASWEALDMTSPPDFWSLRWFQGRLFLSGLAGVFELVNGEISPVDFGSDWPKSTYHLATCPDGMISVGSKDIMLYDGKAWQRIA